MRRDTACSHDHPDIGPCRTVRVNRLTIHLAETGHGPPIVLVHGGQAWAYTWRYQITPLTAAGYRAVALDPPGNGYSALIIDFFARKG